MGAEKSQIILFCAYRSRYICDNRPLPWKSFRGLYNGGHALTGLYRSSVTPPKQGVSMGMSPRNVYSLESG